MHPLILSAPAKGKCRNRRPLSVHLTPNGFKYTWHAGQLLSESEIRAFRWTALETLHLPLQAPWASTPSVERVHWMRIIRHGAIRLLEANATLH